ncbi:SurA N-terminal domain-containing protein [Hyphomicrobium sp.]|uniref:SurA N-terminal domain-containing protein n=1 Tax=Hyphomicrobium sp. TaxID=82 RepID=UPI0025C1683E|nr:SurA N-terminal domain-containing protein [Hyphomicrobium sp.]MCC7251416.1 SurA N-terminal domain-containing protein [Hyphomicrobium sp.]
MLDAMRRGAQGWVAKLLFALLIVSFGVFWNVSDVFRGFGRGAVAKVGEADITVTDFQRAFQNQIRGITLEGGQRLTTEQALMLRLDRQALDQLIAQAAVKTHADQLGLSLSDETLAEGVRNDPDFAGPDGKFSRLGFDGLLRQLNLTEQGFLAVRRDDEVRRQIFDGLSSAVVVPKPTVEELHAFREETRTIEHVQIDAKKVTAAAPDESKLSETYEANKASFMTPEYRKAAVLVLSTDALKSEITLTDDELKTYYADHKATYDKPERRRIQQIAFKDKAAAEAARKELAEGKKNFLDVAKEHGATESDVNLGMLSKSQLIDPKIADAAFALERDKLSEPIEGRFATVLVRAIEIDEGKESTFEEVKDKVRDKLAGERAEGLIQERYDLVEEGRNAGKTLKEIGEELKLKFIDVEAVDNDNKTPDGKTAIDIPDASIALQGIFATGEGAQPDAVELPGSAYVWFDVMSIAEPKQKPFDEVKDDVKALYTEKETGKLLDEMAQKLVDRLKRGEAFAKIAEEAGGTAEVSEQIKRNTSPPGLTTDAVRQAFTLQKGGAGYAQTSDRASRVVFQVKDIFPAASPTKEQADKISKELKDQLANDNLLAYISALKAGLSIHVNETELARATGASTESDQ